MKILKCTAMVISVFIGALGYVILSALQDIIERIKE